MKTITFYSYKGGVGRTLALANVAERLSEFNRRVCILDFDLEAPGVPFKFRGSINPSKIQSGIVDYIYDYQQTLIPPKKIIHYSMPLNRDKRRKGPITIIPSGNTTLQDYWSKLSSIRWSELLFQDNSQGVAFFLDLKTKIEKEINPDILLIDSRTGISEISGIPLSILADEVVLLSANNDENKYGTIQIVNSLTHPELRIQNESPPITLVLSRLPFALEPDEKTREEILLSNFLTNINNALKKQGNPYQLEEALVIHSDRELELRESFKIAWETDEGHSVGSDYLTLFSKLTTGILTEQEIDRFRKMKQADKHYSEYLDRKRTKEGVDLLLKALKLDNTRSEFHLALSGEYYSRHEYLNALKAIDMAIKLNPRSILFHSERAGIYYQLSEYEKMLDDYKVIYEMDPDNPIAMFGFGLYSKMTGDYQKGLEWYKKAIKLRSSDPVMYNNIACIYLSMNKPDEAYESVYKALSLDPKSAIAHSTLAEINHLTGNANEFYRNIELAILYKADFIKIFQKEEVYKQFKDDPKFIGLLQKYNKYKELELLMVL